MACTIHDEKKLSCFFVKSCYTVSMDSPNYPYLQFGQFISRLRKSHKLTAKQLAQKLQMHAHEYEQMEQGSIMPTRKLQTSLATALDVPLQKIMEWALPDNQIAQKPSTEISPINVSKYQEVFAEKIAFMESFANIFEWKPNLQTREALQNLQEDVTSTIVLPFLPEDSVFLIETLLRKGHQFEYLKEYKDIFPAGEDFACYLSRNPVFACHAWHMANKIFFRDKPCKDLETLFNNLTFENFQKTLCVVFNKQEVYYHDCHLPHLQQQSEFSSIAALMVRELRPYIADTINPDHLYMAVLAQNIGELSLCAHIYGQGHPHEDSQKKAPIKKYEVFSQGNLVDHILYELHPVIGAIIAKQMNFPQEVCDAILKHHELNENPDEHPHKDLGPFLSAMKLIARYTDSGFIYLSPDDTKRLLQQFPSLKIKAEDFYNIGLKMCKIRQDLLEVSSAIIDQASPDALMKGENSIKRTVENFKSKGDPVLARMANSIPPRTTREYQHACMMKALRLIAMFKDELLLDLLAKNLGIPQLRQNING